MDITAAAAAEVDFSAAAAETSAAAAAAAAAAASWEATTWTSTLTRCVRGRAPCSSATSTR